MFVLAFFVLKHFDSDTTSVGTVFIQLVHPQPMHLKNHWASYKRTMLLKKEMSYEAFVVYVISLWSYKLAQTVSIGNVIFVYWGQQFILLKSITNNDLVRLKHR